MKQCSRIHKMGSIFLWDFFAVVVFFLRLIYSLFETPFAPSASLALSSSMREVSSLLICSCISAVAFRKAPRYAVLSVGFSDGGAGISAVCWKGSLVGDL